MPRLPATSPWRFFVLAVLLAAALAPACLRVLSVAHAARWAGACLPSQGAQADAVRAGWQSHKQTPVGHPGGACDACGACSALGEAPPITASGVRPVLARVLRLAPVGLASAGATGEGRDAALARGPPRA
jgi:hypothetical protein